MYSNIGVKEALDMADRPFHETLLTLIANASFDNLLPLATFIFQTHIPAGHDEIAAAWTKKIDAKLPESARGDYFGIPEALRQKKAALVSSAKGNTAEVGGLATLET